MPRTRSLSLEHRDRDGLASSVAWTAQDRFRAPQDESRVGAHIPASPTSWAPGRKGSVPTGTIMPTSDTANAQRNHDPWNKGRLLGQKRPLGPKDVWTIRVRLQIEGCKRDVAMRESCRNGWRVPDSRVPLTERTPCDGPRRLAERAPFIRAITAAEPADPAPAMFVFPRIGAQSISAPRPDSVGREGGGLFVFSTRCRRPSPTTP